jgi:SAM-dependent methyltransferase
MATPEQSAAPSVPDRPPDPARPAGSEAYRSQAGRYDRRTDAFHRWRELVGEQLPARPGDAVLDVGCGTGLCLPLLQHKVGSSGTIVGIDASEQMLEVAGTRVTEHGWDNVHLLARSRRRQSTAPQVPPCSRRWRPLPPRAAGCRRPLEHTQQ